MSRGVAPQGGRQGPPSGDGLLYDGPRGLRVGAFRRYPWQTPFADTGPARAHLLVFPRTSVVIQHAGREPLVADPTRVMLYNAGQEYRRRALSERGDECEWFAFPGELVAEALRDRDPGVDDRRDRPFAAVHAPVDAATYLLQRQVVEHLVRRRASADALFVEEAMVRLLARCARAFPAAGGARRAATAADHRELAEACRAILARRLGDPLPLHALAEEVGVSPFHLARVFQRDAGIPLHRYRNALRLRAALARVTDGEDLARVAVDLGFATHSHFTAAFRQAFGVTPSRLRARARARS